uniref:Uncharacterized protein n=1 Tax=Rhizophora mucronata TaxID=61149 RepID=A0A2P2PU16_RHIMU
MTFMSTKTSLNLGRTRVTSERCFNWGRL